MGIGRSNKEEQLYMKKKAFQFEDQRLKEYESVSDTQMTDENDTRLAYRDMHKRFLKAEEAAMSADEYALAKEKHEERKKQIEAAWHSNTTARVRELKQGNQSTKSEKDPAYYERFNMKELETFIKNNDRGGNSEDYNAVATDLELLNRVMSTDNQSEAYGLLKRLKESCDYYIEKKNPTFKSGKIRKAIITQISRKVNAELEKRRDEFAANQKKTLANLEKDKSEESLAAAFKSHHNMVYQVMKGNIDMNDADRMKLDKDMTKVLSEMMDHQQVAEGQSDTLSSRFFNNLGWSSNPIRISKNLGNFGKTMKTSPYKKRMYHTISTPKGKPDAFEYALQFSGLEKGKMFYGIGRFGKGTYCSAPVDASKIKNEEKARANSFDEYGKAPGSVCFMMTLNENARIVTKDDMLKLEATIKQKFPETYNKLCNTDRASCCGYRDELTMLASLLGYNTIIGDGVPGVEYVTTADRKALTMDNILTVRGDGNEEKEYNEVVESLPRIVRQRKEEEAKKKAKNKK